MSLNISLCQYLIVEYKYQRTDLDAAYGSAAGCEAGLRPAGDDLNTSRGYAPGTGSA